MAQPDPDTAREQSLARRTRVAAMVIAATMLLWMGAQFVGGRIGLAPRFAFLFDLAAIAAFVWAMIVLYQIRRARRDSEE